MGASTSHRADGNMDGGTNDRARRQPRAGTTRHRIPPDAVPDLDPTDGSAARSTAAPGTGPADVPGLADDGGSGAGEDAAAPVRAGRVNRHVDFHAVYEALPAGVALLTPELVYVEANPAYLLLAGRRREELIGRYIFDAFPDNPHDRSATGTRNLAASLRRVATTGQRDAMAIQRYDTQPPGEPGVWDERYWSILNVPVLDSGGRVQWVLHRVEEVTELLRAKSGSPASFMEAELYNRARELQEVNERLRGAYAREREVALVLQSAMLPAPSPHAGLAAAAVRYRPAQGALNVCGDWYDLVDLPQGRTAVAVGDVVGHGLKAAAVMGQLRSALTATLRIADGPAHALEALGLHARSVPGAESATAVAVIVDPTRRSLLYSSAGHLPPALLGPDGAVTFLDRATDPPLGAHPEHLPRPQAAIGYPTGAILVLYTDGLVERRSEDIDASLARLAHALARHRTLAPESLADALLADLLPPDGATDDTALMILPL
ncbi:PP2C family protein-serine/threonine phosphatase [Embleya sp. NPDC050154]|uniref:PP2C family protein-serine/threonine phosphatase n=1 Tax=unclassified Embleya TaxID=2699296 RepID=UPI0037BB7B4B